MPRTFEQQPIEGFPELEYDQELPFRTMGRLVLTTIINSLKELVDREMVSEEEIVDRLRQEGF